MCVAMGELSVESIVDKDETVAADDCPTMRHRIVESLVTVLLGDDDSSTEIHEEHPDAGVAHPEKRATRDGLVELVDGDGGVKRRAAKGRSRGRDAKVASYAGIDYEFAPGVGEVDLQRVRVTVRRE